MPLCWQRFVDYAVSSTLYSRGVKVYLDLCHVWTSDCVCERERASRWALCKRGSMVCEEIHLSSLMFLLFWKCTPPGSQGVCSLTEGGRAGLCCAGLSLSPVRVSDPMDCSPPGSSVHGDSPGKNTGEGCHALLQGIFPTQGSNPGPLHCRCILYHLSQQGSPRILEWVAYPFSRGSSQPRNQTGSPALQADSLPATREAQNGATFPKELRPGCCGSREEADQGPDEEVSGEAWKEDGKTVIKWKHKQKLAKKRNSC